VDPLGIRNIGANVVLGGEATGHGVPAEAIQPVEVPDPQDVPGPIDGLAGPFGHDPGEMRMVKMLPGSQHILVEALGGVLYPSASL
jgi:hypothetical protein